MEPTIVNNKHFADEFKRKIKFALIAIFLFSLLVSLCIFVLAVSGANNNAKNSNTTTTSTQSSTSEEATASSETTTSSEEVSTLPEGWSYVVENNCNVSIPVPPKEAPYIYSRQVGESTSTTYWHVGEDVATGSTIGSSTGSWILFTADEFMGDGFTYLGLMCIKDGSYPTLESIKTKAQADYENNPNKGQTINDITIIPPEFKTVSLWGETVLQVYLSDSATSEPSYYLVKGNTAYYIRKSLSSINPEVDPQVAETLETIFSNLSFN